MLFALNFSQITASQLFSSHLLTFKNESFSFIFVKYQLVSHSNDDLCVLILSKNKLYLCFVVLKQKKTKNNHNTVGGKL